MSIHAWTTAFILVQFAASEPVSAADWRHFSPILSSQTRSLGSEEANTLLASVCQTTVHMIDGIGQTCSTRNLSNGFSDIIDHTFHPKGVIFGHFLGPETNDAAISGWSAETHPSLWGGTLLLSKLGNSWIPRWYRSAVITDSCEKLVLPGHREILLCENEDSGMGHALHYLYSVDFEHPSELHESLLAKAESFKDTCVEQVQVLSPIRWTEDKRGFSLEIVTTEWNRTSTAPYCANYPQRDPAPLRLLFAIEPQGMVRKS